MKKALKQIFSIFFICLIFLLNLGIFSPKSAYAINFINVDLYKGVEQNIQHILSNKQLIKDAKKFASLSPETLCKAYTAKLQGRDDSNQTAIEDGAEAILTILAAITSASTAGAGALSGYAGIASAVSELGLGGLTTMIAGMLGSNVAGAAATAVVTSAVGGPLVMAILITSGTAATGYGVYKLGDFSVEKLGKWAGDYCSSKHMM